MGPTDDFMSQSQETCAVHLITHYTCFQLKSVLSFQIEISSTVMVVYDIPFPDTSTEPSSIILFSRPRLLQVEFTNTSDAPLKMKYLDIYAYLLNKPLTTQP